MHRVTESRTVLNTVHTLNPEKSCSYRASPASTQVTKPFTVPCGVQGWATHSWRVSLYCLTFTEIKGQKSLYPLNPQVRARGQTHAFTIHQFHPQLTPRTPALIIQEAVVMHSKVPQYLAWISSQRCGTHSNSQQGLSLFSKILGTQIYDLSWDYFDEQQRN